MSGSGESLTAVSHSERLSAIIDTFYNPERLIEWWIADTDEESGVLPLRERELLLKKIHGEAERNGTLKDILELVRDLAFHPDLSVDTRDGVLRILGGSSFFPESLINFPDETIQKFYSDHPEEFLLEPTSRDNFLNLFMRAGLSVAAISSKELTHEEVEKFVRSEFDRSVGEYEGGYFGGAIFFFASMKLVLYYLQVGGALEE